MSDAEQPEPPAEKSYDALMENYRAINAPNLVIDAIAGQMLQAADIDTSRIEQRAARKLSRRETIRKTGIFIVNALAHASFYPRGNKK